MDEQTQHIHSLLINSISLSQDLRNEAEKQLLEYSKHEGFLSILLGLFISPNINDTAKQAGLIFFKNSIIKSFPSTHQAKHPSDSSTLSPTELHYIKGHIIQAYLSCNPNHRKLIFPCITKLIRDNYQKVWPELLPNLFHTLQISSDVQHLIGAVDILRIAIDAENTSSKTNDHPVFVIGFPLLLNIASKTFGTGSWDDESLLLMKSIVKTFFTSIKFVLPKDLQSESAIEPWVRLCIHLLSMPLPNPGLAYDPELDELNPFFQIKKWALHVSNRLSSRYGLDEQTKYRSSNYSSFSKLYMAKYSLPSLEVMLSLIQDICSNSTTYPPRLITLICDYLDSAILSNKLWKRIKVHLEPIIKLFIFPRLCFTDEDERIWAEDPYEYVHKRLDPYEDLESVSWAASHLLGNMVKRRKKSVFLSLLSFINDIFVGFSNTSSPYYNNVRAKEGALFVVGTISSTILDASELKGQTEVLIMSAVLPDMYSESSFLKARACWVIQNYEDLRYSTVENVLAVFQGILRCLGDIAPGTLPIRIQAALALGVFLQFEEVTPLMTANLAPIVESLLDLTNQSDMDSLSYVLDKLVSLYSVELTPFGYQLTQQLCGTLMRLISHPKVLQSLTSEENSSTTTIFQSGAENNDDDFDLVTDKMMTAMGLLKTLTTLVISVKSNSELTEKMEILFHEPINHILRYKISDLYEDILELIDSITFVRKSISQQMWTSVFPVLIDYFMTGPMSDYLGDLLPCFDNFISYGSTLVSGSQQIQSMFVSIVEKVMRVSEYVENDRICGCQLMESMLLYCRGSIDNLIPLFLTLSLERFPKYLSKRSTVHHLAVVLNALIYDTVLTVNVFSSSSIPSLSEVLSYISSSKGAFVRVHDKRLIVIAMTQLLRSKVDVSPVCPLIFSLLQDAFETLPKSLDNRKKLEQQSENDENEDYNSAAYDDDQDDEELNEEDEDTLQFIKESSQNDGKSLETSDLNDEDEDEEDLDDYDSDWEESELEEELYHETPLDGINLFEMATSTISELSGVNPPAFNYLNQSAEKNTLIKAINDFYIHVTASSSEKTAIATPVA